MRCTISWLLLLAVGPSLVRAQLPERLLTFDGGQADVCWEAGHWKLMAGGVCLEDFGNQQAEAREALRVVRELRLTQQGTIGAPRPVMEYWLSDGRAPTVAGVRWRTLPIEPESLRVEQVQGQWCVRDAQRLLFTFGPHADQAHQALEVIQRYGFNRIGYLGSPTPTMIFFVNDLSRSAKVSMPAPSSPGFRVVTSGPEQPQRAGESQEATKPAAEEPKLPATRDDLIRQVAHSQVYQLGAAGPLLPDRDFLGDRFAIDWRQVQLQQQNGTWLLTSGSDLLANLGTNEAEARQALAALQAYRFTEQRRVGEPTAVLAYFLVNGQAARGSLFGLESVAFELEKLTVQPMGGYFAICEGQRPLLWLAGTSAQARQVLQILRELKVDHIRQIGPSGPYAMTLLIRER